MSVVALRAGPPAPELVSRQRLGMAQLGPQGLSEQWLLRECGDRHWQLIATAMGQERAVFADAAGRPVYAAFCATVLELAPPAPGGVPGGLLTLRSGLFRLGGSRIGSEHALEVEGRPAGLLRMISTFVGHGPGGSNRAILRRPPLREVALPPAGPGLAALAARSRETVRSLCPTAPAGPPLLAAVPVPGLDFNAVGLLYFPAFSALAERAHWADPLARPGALARREIVYLGNIDPGDGIALHPEPGHPPGAFGLWRSDAVRIGFARSRYHQ
ncbi:Pnap_2097 family protein [Oceanicella sp. SM1341]|uniref:Pnap_2097 family protein n=1 Tax=Oceanicella sp. SM1341 TaxID=1548889 RepID=UPI000E49CABF|nr:Pnap_2097 family protein [Oceanicella sp. SM1341]